MFSFVSKSLFFMAFISLLTACASLPDEKNIQNRAEQFAQKSAKPAQSLIQQAKLKLQKANTELLAFYAPTYMKQAQTHFEKAKQLYSEKAENIEIREQTQLSVEYVESGLRNKKIVKEYLTSTLDNRAVLQRLKADQLFPEDFAKITEQQLALIEKVEQRKELEARAQQKPLLEAMKQLEVKTIKQTYLSKTYTMLEQAQALKAEETLPTLYKQTMDNIAQIERFIAANPRQKKQISAYTKDSLFEAERLYSLARLTQKITTKSEQNLEDLVLSFEAHLQKIAKAMKYGDISNLSLDDQSLLLSEYGEKIIKKNKHALSSIKQQKELEKWKRKVVLLEAEIRRLKRQQN